MVSSFYPWLKGYSLPCIFIDTINSIDAEFGSTVNGGFRRSLYIHICVRVPALARYIYCVFFLILGLLDIGLVDRAVGATYFYESPALCVGVYRGIINPLGVHEPLLVTKRPVFAFPRSALNPRWWAKKRPRFDDQKMPKIYFKT